jgi:queuine tRNA-ribosyltransferase catalytic subunit
MPVATQAALKGLTPQQTEDLGISLILNNTYHLNLRPGTKILEAAGGAHKFQGWRKNLLTVICPYSTSSTGHSQADNHEPRSNQDSGGFQMVSLSSFTQVTEEGVLFASPFTGEPTMLTVSDFRRVFKRQTYNPVARRIHIHPSKRYLSHEES